MTTTTQPVHVVALDVPGAQPVQNYSDGTVVDGAALLLAINALSEIDKEAASPLTCHEADLIAAVLAYGGHEQAAVDWLWGHALDHDEPNEDDPRGHDTFVDAADSDAAQPALLAYVRSL